MNETHNNSLFFWFFPAKNKPKDAPLVLWLQGGPGWPTMYGLFKEHGPFLIGKCNCNRVNKCRHQLKSISLLGDLKFEEPHPI